MDIAGAKALYLQDAGSRAIRAVSRAVTGGGELHALLQDNTTETATFTDAGGATVDVTLNKTLQLNADYLLVDWTNGTASGISVVALATGTMADLTVTPDNWERIRVRAGTAYYVSGGALQRLDLASMGATDISHGDRISGSSLVYLDAADNVHTFHYVSGNLAPENQVRVYYADGRPVYTLGWGDPGNMIFAQDATATSFRIVLEDEATAKLYRVGASNPEGFISQEIIFNDTGFDASPAATIYDPTYYSTYEISRPMAGKAYLDNTAFSVADFGKVVSLNVVAGAITSANLRTRAAFSYEPIRFKEGKFYAASASGIDGLDMASGVEAAVLTTSGITDFEILSDQVFFSTASGVYQYDTVSTQTTPYTGEVVPVAE